MWLDMDEIYLDLLRNGRYNSLIIFENGDKPMKKRTVLFAAILVLALSAGCGKQAMETASPAAAETTTTEATETFTDSETVITETTSTTTEPTSSTTATEKATTATSKAATTTATTKATTTVNSAEIAAWKEFDRVMENEIQWLFQTQDELLALGTQVDGGSITYQQAKIRFEDYIKQSDNAFDRYVAESNRAANSLQKNQWEILATLAIRNTMIAQCSVLYFHDPRKTNYLDDILKLTGEFLEVYAKQYVIGRWRVLQECGYSSEEAQAKAIADARKYER